MDRLSILRPSDRGSSSCGRSAALLVRVGRGEAIAWGRRLRASIAVELVRIDEELEEEAWSILESHADKRWSYVDATSFALMARERLTVAFSFDQDFAQRGLALVPASY